MLRRVCGSVRELRVVVAVVVERGMEGVVNDDADQGTQFTS